MDQENSEKVYEFDLSQRESLENCYATIFAGWPLVINLEWSDTVYVENGLEVNFYLVRLCLFHNGVVVGACSAKVGPGNKKLKITRKEMDRIRDNYVKANPGLDRFDPKQELTLECNCRL